MADGDAWKHQQWHRVTFGVSTYVPSSRWPVTLVRHDFHGEW